nr:potassium-transporting ATPase subunit KdpA [uncultured Cohaesibacter sp.]
MLTHSLIFASLIIGSTALMSWPLGSYMKWAMDPASDKPSRFTDLFRQLGGVACTNDQGWKSYTLAMLTFNAVMFIIAFGILSLQQVLPLNPDNRGSLDGSLIFNTVASFTTNTNLQHYSGEITLSYLSQIGALMWLQFVSAATGLSALAALARGLSGRQLGNFFVDVQRASFLVLLPGATVIAILLIFGGVPMTFDGSVVAHTLEGLQQTIARGPVAAFVAIKQFGTNGGGFFGSNAAHPLENPSFWTNIVEMVTVILIPMACVWMFGHITKRQRHAVVIFSVMLVFLLIKTTLAITFEAQPTQALANLAIEQSVGNIEGKELRFGSASSPLWSVLTTSTSNGSVDAMQDSLNPITSLMSLIGMWLNSTFGGVGVGMLNMFLYIILGVFIAGMMIGRTPEYLGWRVESKEVKLVLITLLAHGLFILGGTAIFAATPWGTVTLGNSGPHGFTELLYEFTSASANNGSGFEGLSDNTIPWNVSTGIVMLFARFIPIIMPLAIVGSLSSKQHSAETSGSLSVEGGVFATMLASTIVVIGSLTFFPAATLGPIAEHVVYLH